MGERENDSTASNGTARGRKRARSQDGGWSVADADRALRAFVAERPFVAVGLALAAGYVMARSLSAVR